MACKLEANVVIKSPADKYFQRLSKELYHAPDASSDKIHGIEVHEGDFQTHGSIKTWSYTLDGKKESFKEKFEIDEETKSVSMIALEGHLLERYKEYRIDYKITRTEDGVAEVKIMISYQKQNEDISEPHKEMDFLVNVIKDIDHHLCQ